MNCACGKPLHYEDSARRNMVNRLVELYGELIKVGTPRGVWLVPRHYISLHGVVASELPELAVRYGFEEVSNSN